MKAEELAVQILSALHGGGVNASHGSVPLIEPLLRSYGLACAMAERERCWLAADEVAGPGGSSYENGWHMGASKAACVIKSRPTGDALMKEIEG